jgi:signal peptidase II
MDPRAIAAPLIVVLLVLLAGAVFWGKRVPAAQRWLILLGAFAIGVVLDLGSKEIAFHYLPKPRDTTPIWSWFSWTHARNEGAAFGMFRGKHDFFMVVTLCAFVAVPFFVHVARERVKITALVMGLILAGVAGNFWDRMTFGYVRDFIDVHTAPAGTLYDLTTRLFNTNVWPTFNVADMFITGGAAAAILFLGGEPDEDPAEESAEQPAEEPSDRPDPEGTTQGSPPAPA